MRPTLGTIAARALGWLVPLAAFGYMLAYPLQPNGSDEGIILYGAKRLLAGQAIYRDFFEIITPGSFYFFAGVFALTGPSLRAARFAMAAVNLLTALLLFSFTRRIAGVAEAVLVVLVFAMVCVPVWAIASPHWISTALCLCTAAALLAERWPDRRRAIVTGLLAGLTFCVQQQRGVFLALWVGGALGLIAWLFPPGERGRWWLRQTAWVAAAWLVVVGGVLGYSAWRASPEQLVACLFTFVVENYRRGFVGKVHWAGSFFGTARLTPTWAWMLRWLPVAMVVEAVLLARRLSPVPGPYEVVRAALLLLAACMAASVLYFPDFVHVSFIAPFLLIVAARVTYGARTAPALAMRRAARGPAAVACAVCLVAIAAKGWTNLAAARRAAPERMESAMGPLDVDHDQRQLVETVRAAATLGGRNVFVYPTDSWLYLAAGADNPTAYSLLLRSYNTPEQFDDAIAALERRRTPFLVVGDYLIKPGDPIIGYVDDHYQLVAGPNYYKLYQRRR